MSRSTGISILLAVAASFTGALAHAEDGTTPQLWRQHVSPGGFAENLRGIEVAGGQLDANLASRFRLRWNDFASDQDLYEYLRANLTGVKLGQGQLEAHLFLRAAFDLDGTYHRQWSDSFYYVFRDSLDAERDGHVGALRAYTANLSLKGVLPGTSLTLGRTYVSHLDSVQLDGGELLLGPDDLQAFVYAGRPVSFFLDTKGDWAYGAGLDLRPIGLTHLRAQYLGTKVESVHDETFALRADQGFAAGPLDGNLYAEYRYLDGPSRLELSGTAHASKTGTTVTLLFRELFDDVGVPRTQAFGFPVNPFAITLLPQAKHELYHLDLSQALSRFFLLSGAAEWKHARGDFLLDNRSYRKYRLALDVDALPTQGTHLQLAGEAWNVDPLLGQEHSGRLHGFVRLSQSILPGLDAWAGTGWEQFKFDQAARQVKQSIRKYYLGAQWAPCASFSVLLDLDAENSDVFSDLGTSSLSTNYTAQAMLNVAL